jgi:DNA mismatch repair ATPase MutS
MPTWFTAIERMIADRINTNSNEYYLAEEGVTSTVSLLKNIYRFAVTLADKLKENNAPAFLVKNNDTILELFSKPEYKEILDRKKYKSYDIMRFDYMFRNTNKRHILFFLNLVYEYDALFSVAKAADRYNMHYPEILPETETVLEIEGLFHPFLENAVPSNVHFDSESNLLFISGPNMAGKSTFLKALGIAVYLAHVGFPVPAGSMKISILGGLSTTINISDNLSSGYSHFYAEVMRIKNVAHKLEKNNKMLVLFDELFRGTNVKDAYDGTVAIVSAFARIKTSFFVISTHIVEAAKELESKRNIQFGYFDIEQRDGHPVYTYQLKEGISDVRLGMYIINKEGLIELINNINN